LTHNRQPMLWREMQHQGLFASGRHSRCKKWEAQSSDTRSTASSVQLEHEIGTRSFQKTNLDCRSTDALGKTFRCAVSARVSDEKRIGSPSSRVASPLLAPSPLAHTAIQSLPGQVGRGCDQPGAVAAAKKPVPSLRRFALQYVTAPTDSCRESKLRRVENRSRLLSRVAESKIRQSRAHALFQILKLTGCPEGALYKHPSLSLDEKSRARRRFLPPHADPCLGFVPPRCQHWDTRRTKPTAMSW